MTITTAQIRGARGILDWSQSDLSKRTGISATSIGAIENNQTTPRASTLETIRKVFETFGIEFMGLDGVRLKSGDIAKYTGKQGFIDFYEDIYFTLRDTPGEVLVNNVDETEFMKWGTSEHFEEFNEKISDIEGITYKILIKEGDYNFVASSYAEYKWIPKEEFSTVPFYVFGKKLAILLFNNEIEIIVLNYPAVAEAYRTQFEKMWKISLTPDNKEVANG